MIKNKRILSYLFFEILPSFVLGLIIFLLVILMFQLLRLTEFAIIHGVSLTTLTQIVGYVCISMTPALLPMSLLFAVLMTYGRLSQDSEIIAMKASGVSAWSILVPALLLSTLVAFFSAHTSFELAPWGNRQFEVLYSQIGSTRAGASIKEGTFSEGFFNMVFFANKVDSERGFLEDVFIFNEQNPSSPITIIAHRGQIIQSSDLFGHSASLRLFDGNIHRQGESHTRIQFETYDLHLSDAFQKTEREKSPQSLTLKEISTQIQKGHLQGEDLWTLQSEYHKRWALAVLCLVFGMIGVGLGMTTNRRSAKAGGFVLSVILIIVFWVLYLTFEGLARKGKLPPALALWAPNIIYGFLGLETLRRNWN